MSLFADTVSTDIYLFADTLSSTASSQLEDFLLIGCRVQLPLAAELCLQSEANPKAGLEENKKKKQFGGQSEAQKSTPHLP